jgi:hypothetical protein
MSYLVNTDGYIININDGCLVKDMLSYKPIHINNATEIFDKICDIYYLFSKLYDILANISNNNISSDILINKILENNSISLSNKILNIISDIMKLLNFPIKTQKMLLSLVPNHCDILFKILSKLDSIDYSDINFLFDNYHFLLRNDILLIQKKFLLNNDIGDEIIKQLLKQVVKEDHRTLLFISDYKLSYDIIKEAVKSNGLALQFLDTEKITDICYKYKYKYKYIDNINKLNKIDDLYCNEILDNGNHYPCNKILEPFNCKVTNEILEIAVKQNGLALKYIHHDKQTDKIIEEAVSQNGLALEYVDYDKQTDKIIKIAVTNNGCALEYVQNDKITIEVLEIAIKNNPFVIQYIHILIN